MASTAAGEKTSGSSSGSFSRFDVSKYVFFGYALGLKVGLPPSYYKSDFRERASGGRERSGSDCSGAIDRGARDWGASDWRARKCGRK